MEGLSYQRKSNLPRGANSRRIPQPSGLAKQFIDSLVEAFYGRIRSRCACSVRFSRRLLIYRWVAAPRQDEGPSGHRSPSFMGAIAASRCRLTPSCCLPSSPAISRSGCACSDATLEEIAPTAEARVLLHRALRRIAQSLKLGLFYRPEQMRRRPEPALLASSLSTLEQISERLERMRIPLKKGGIRLWEALMEQAIWLILGVALAGCAAGIVFLLTRRKSDGADARIAEAITALGRRATDSDRPYG